jgi:spermidine/putrescine-binding protein
MDSARDFIGVAAKTLGLSLNATSADLSACAVTEEQLLARCRALRAQVRVFSDKELFSALAGRDVWAAVGTSSQAMAAARMFQSIQIVAPSSGTALSARLWVLPNKVPGVPLNVTDAAHASSVQSSLSRWGI